MKTIAIYCWNLLVLVAMVMSMMLTIAFWFGLVLPIRLGRIVVARLRG